MGSHCQVPSREFTHTRTHYESLELGKKKKAELDIICIGYFAGGAISFLIILYSYFLL